MDWTLNGPRTSECISSRIFDAWWVVTFGIFVLACLPSWQLPQMCLGKCSGGSPFTAAELTIRCSPRMWKWPNRLCQMAALFDKRSELISGPWTGETPRSLYRPLVASLGAKASISRERLLRMKQPSDLKISVLSWSVREPTLSRFLVMPGVYKTEGTFIFPERNSTSTFPMPDTVWFCPPVDLTWDPFVCCREEKTQGSPETWWVAPESKY